jgi:GT2 family glycosyltransferase
MPAVTPGTHAPAALPPAARPVAPPPALAGIVVHWRDETRLAELTAAWPSADRRFELIVIDNSGTAPPPPPESPADGESAAHRRLSPGRNLGFAGGVNAGLAASCAPLVLLLNPDAVPEPGALDSLLDGFAAHPEAAGLAPHLEGPGGEAQFGWQLRRLPTVWGCLRQTLPWPSAADAGGAHAEPPPGTPVEQPAAAALALRRSALTAAGGLDERFHPAWFEDVDLARRLRAAGDVILYWPAARFRHALGSTVPRLGYGRFLFIYYRNLDRYLRKHHGAAAAWAARLLLLPSVALRLPLLALRLPRRAATRREAAAGLMQTLAGAATGWRRPRDLADLAEQAEHAEHPDLAARGNR